MVVMQESVWPTTRFRGVNGAIVAACFLAAACSPPDDRVVVPGSDPQIACSPEEGPRSSKDEESAIARAKAAWASAHEKNPYGGTYSPANMAKFEPYSATLKDGVWRVQGTVPPGYSGYVPITSVCRNNEGAVVSWIKVP
jgi:hypothetical protein